MASSQDRLSLMPTPGGPGELSPSFAQTGAELSLDDSDIDDLDLQAEVGGGGGPSDDVYEMRERDASRDRGRWDSDGPVPGQGHGRRDSSASSVASFQLYTPDEEDAVRRKFDRKLVVFVALLYMLSFLDRSSSSASPNLPTDQHHD
jgi:hypothetical protein